jgi:hypothetical protein
MFYLPSKRPYCFLTHFRDGCKPLDPREWISMIPNELLTSPPPLVLHDIHNHGDTPGQTDRQVQWAIGYWRTVGCVKGKGRTQLWLLAKRLAEAACDDAEMQDVFY